MEHNNNQILRLPEVLNKVGLKRSSIYKLIKEGKFPRQIKLSERSCGWVNTEIDERIKGRSQSRF